MGDRFHVRIDLARIQSNMLRDEGGRLTERQIRNWLISAGFTPDDDGPGWTADRDALRQLDRSELLETTPIRRSGAGKSASAHTNGQSHPPAHPRGRDGAEPRSTSKTNGRADSHRGRAGNRGER